MRQAFLSKKLSKPASKYSHVVKAGSHYYFSGMLAMDRETGVLVGATVREQADKIFENVQVLMKEFDLTFDHLAIARIFTTEMDKFADINAAWENVFNNTKAAPPARTTLGVVALPLKALIEIEFTFHKKG